MSHYIYVYEVRFDREGEFAQLGDLTGSTPRVYALDVLKSLLSTEGQWVDTAVKHVVQVGEGSVASCSEPDLRAKLSVGRTADTRQKIHDRSGRETFSPEPAHVVDKGDGSFVDSYLVARLPRGAKVGHIAIHAQPSHRYKGLLERQLKKEASSYSVLTTMGEIVPKEAVLNFAQPQVRELRLRSWVEPDSVTGITGELDESIEKVKIETRVSVPRRPLGSRTLVEALAEYDGPVNIGGIPYDEAHFVVKYEGRDHSLKFGSGEATRSGFDVTDQVEEFVDADGLIDDGKMHQLCFEVLELCVGG